jgi:hypothetical protein
VAASSFDMKVTDPRDLLKQINLDRVKTIQGLRQRVIAATLRSSASLVYVEPASVEDGLPKPSVIPRVDEQITVENSITPLAAAVRRGRIQRLGDFIDTDAVSPRRKPLDNCLLMFKARTC